MLKREQSRAGWGGRMDRGAYGDQSDPAPWNGSITSSERSAQSASLPGSYHSRVRGVHSPWVDGVAVVVVAFVVLKREGQARERRRGRVEERGVDEEIGGGGDVERDGSSQSVHHLSAIY